MADNEGRTTELTEQEKDRLQNVFETIQNDAIFMNGLRNISGAFCQTRMYNHDDRIINIEVKWGVQDGDENTVHTDHVKLDRVTMKPVRDDDVEQIARSMSPGQ